jgi:hypothetical protein
MMIHDVYCNRTEGQRHSSIKHAAAKLIASCGGRFLVSAQLEHGYSTWSFNAGDCRPLVECSYPIIMENATFEHYKARNGLYPSMIFDIGIIENGKVIGCVEIMRHHWLDDRKKQKIQDAGIFCIGISAHDDQWNTGTAHLDARVLVVPPGSSHHRTPVRAM